nr:MAG: major capsid protein [Microviridae sp.]
MQKKLQNHFSFNQTAIDMPRSRFDRPYDHKLTFNSGRLIPLYVDADILPGDTVEMDLASVVRENTPIFPVMDNAYMDVYAFFIPNRLVWEHWKEFMGENNTDAWTQKTEYTVPQIKCNHSKQTDPNPETGEYNYDYCVLKGSVLDYMGIPISDANNNDYAKPDEFYINALPVRAYYKVWNEWFRNENVTDPIPVDTGDSNGAIVTENAGSAYYTKDKVQYGGGQPLKVARFHDYFSSALPDTQKGEAVLIPFTGDLPVIGTGKALGLKGDFYGLNASYEWEKKFSANVGMQMSENTYMLERTDSEGEKHYYSSGSIGINGLSSDAYNQPLGAPINAETGTDTSGQGIIGVTDEIGKSGMIATTNGASITATINQLRQAFAVQKLLEAYARGGTRYTEILKSIFGVQSSDARLQRSEYLGGTRISINMDSIVQTSATTSTSPQGNVSGYSISGMNTSLFTKSFEEHGTLLVVGCIRPEHSYQQGLNKMWTRKDALDYYYPQLANIGEMPIYNRELYLQGSGHVNADTGKEYDDEVFGYQEAWAEYRYKPNEVSGAFRSTYQGALDAYHYGDAYKSMPTLSDAFMLESGEEIDRTIAVQQNLEDQFYGDFYFDCVYSRCMPTYSIPGLIDHH